VVNELEKGASEVSVSKMRSIDLSDNAIFIVGCGYVGTALAQRLLALGARVGALTRNLQQLAHLRAIGVHECIAADLDDPSWMQQVRGDYRILVNCVSSAGGGLAGYKKSYVDGQKIALAWAQAEGIERCMYTSSTSVYPQNQGERVDASAATQPATETAQCLLQAEAMLVQCASAFERHYVFRLAGIYGPGRHFLLDQLRQGAAVIAGRGDYTLNLIHRDDIVELLVLAMRAPAQSGIYNVADLGAAHKAEVLAWLAQQTGQPQPSFDPNLSSPRLRRRSGTIPDRVICSLQTRQAFDWQPRYQDYRMGYTELLRGLET
jgi:nucleoside-diphosphate-sugar epimerase